MRTQRDECQRCHGLMVECYSDVASPDYAGQDVIGRRCINCGEYVDRLVLLNRWAPCGQALAKTHDDDPGCGNVTHRCVVTTSPGPRPVPVESKHGPSSRLRVSS